ncbi:DUF397 domain-containing protein [Streptomyces sp. NPDC037389]|uniref:DUF397 domain-containing protein n=1 Tax=Streptomyces sp. NPDC037389 TaxID=3155369 RepID=UPI0033C7F3F8
MTYSNCFYVDMRYFPWRKSSYSGVQSDCIEIADGIPALTPVRDSKNPHGPVLLFEAGAWSTFVRDLKAGYIADPR